MCATSSSPPGAVKEKNVFNLVEFYIFNRRTAPGGDEDIWAIKLYSGRMQIHKLEMLFRF
jgi:hypothetical protein